MDDLYFLSFPTRNFYPWDMLRYLDDFVMFWLDVNKRVNGLMMNDDVNE